MTVARHLLMQGRTIGGGGAPPEEKTEEQTQSNYDITLQEGVHSRVGQKLPIINREVTKIAFLLNKIGTPTGDVVFTIRKVSDDSIIVSKLWGDAADLQAALTWEELELDTPTFVNEEVRLMVEYVGSSKIGSRFQSTDVKAGESRADYYLGGYQDTPDHDGTYRYKYYEV